MRAVAANQRKRHQITHSALGACAARLIFPRLGPSAAMTVILPAPRKGFAIVARSFRPLRHHGYGAHLRWVQEEVTLTFYAHPTQTFLARIARSLCVRSRPGLSYQPQVPLATVPGDVDLEEYGEASKAKALGRAGGRDAGALGLEILRRLA